MLKILRTHFCANPKQLAANSNIIEPGYLERTSVFFSNLGLPDKRIIELKREIGH